MRNKNNTQCGQNSINTQFQYIRCDRKKKQEIKKKIPRTK